MGEKGNIEMYKYVTDAEVSGYRSYCAGILTELRDTLLDKEINTQFILEGSGARNMVMRNGNGPFDLDYNLRILSMPDEYWSNLGRLKNEVMNELNTIVHGTWFSDSKDSTSVITSIIHDNDGVEFKIDVAIIGQNSEGNYCRLIHDKSWFPTRYLWNEVPNSHNVKSKVDYIKSKRRWNEVRDLYEELKNIYLERRDYYHPSFVCYIEAVNSVYDRCNKRKK